LIVANLALAGFNDHWPWKKNGLHEHHARASLAAVQGLLSHRHCETGVDHNSVF
jgi:hypothetical protein